MKILPLAALLVSLWSPAAGAAQAPEFAGQIRVRGESRNPGADYGVPGGTDLMLLRTRLDAAVKPAKDIKVFLQLQDSRSAGSEASVAANGANVDLKQ